MMSPMTMASANPFSPRDATPQQPKNILEMLVEETKAPHVSKFNTNLTKQKQSKLSAVIVKPMAIRQTNVTGQSEKVS
mgnify:FL=1